MKAANNRKQNLVVKIQIKSPLSCIKQGTGEPGNTIGEIWFNESRDGWRIGLPNLQGH